MNPRPRNGEGKNSPGQRPQITDFVLQERLGSGSYAIVYKAFWKALNETVAIKKIQKSRLNPAAIDNILLEIEILKSIKHDFIVEMKDFTWDADNIYLILEYCKGGDLSTFIKSRRRLPEPVCRRLLQQLGKALEFLRSRHIAHMDLKPKNILLTCSRDPFIKIADFGFAQYLKPTDAATDFRGSPLYMAPEMFLSRVYDARVDLWSVGVILYECLFGRAPYCSKTIEELVTKITDGSLITFPTDVSITDSCRDLLQRLLKKDPNQRVTFEQFFNHKFLDFEHFPTEASYEKALTICKAATEQDKAKNYETAVKGYLTGLDYLVPALIYEKNEARKKVMKLRVQEYMGRTEQLKHLIARERKKSSSPCLGLNADIEYIDETSIEYLKRVFAGDAVIVAALESGCTAEYMEDVGHYKLAIEYYEVAIERLIRMSKGLAPGDKKTKLQRQIADWLEKAESVNAKLKMFERDDIAQPSPSPLMEEPSNPKLEASSRKYKNNPMNSVFRSHW